MMGKTKLWPAAVPCAIWFSLDAGVVFVSNFPAMKTKILLAFACVGIASTASAQVLFNSLADGSFAPEFINGSDVAGQSFTSGNTAETITGLTLNLGFAPGGGTTVVSLYGGTGSPNYSLGTDIATLGSVPNSPVSFNTSDISIPLSDFPVLSPDSTYWIVVTHTGNGSTLWGETFDSQNGVGVADQPSILNGSFYPLGIESPFLMEVTASSAPDATSTLWALGLAAGGLGILRRKLAVPSRV